MSRRAGEGGPGLHLLLWQRDLRCKFVSGECLLQRFAVIGQSCWMTLAVGVTFYPKGFMEFWPGPEKLNVRISWPKNVLNFTRSAPRCIGCIMFYCVCSCFVLFPALLYFVFTRLTKWSIPVDDNACDTNNLLLLPNV